MPSTPPKPSIAKPSRPSHRSSTSRSTARSCGDRMSQTSDEVRRRTEALPDCFLPLKEVVYRCFPSGCTIQEGAVRVGRFRKYQHDHYRVTLFPPAHPNWLIRTSQIELPLDY